MALNSEIRRYREDFYKIYDSKILPFFRTYESERKKRLTIVLTVLIVALSLTAILVKACFDMPDWSELLGGLTLVTCLIGICVPSFMSYSFVSDIKGACMKKALSALGNISWQNSALSIISDTELKSSELFGDFAGSTADDSFSGSYKDVGFKVSELYTYTDGGKSTFKGVVIVFKSNKTIRNKAIIAAKSDKKLRKNGIPYLGHIIAVIIIGLVAILCFTAAFVTSLISQKILFSGFALGLAALIGVLVQECVTRHNMNKNIMFDNNMKEIKLEDVEFSKRYAAYSSDEVEGRYLITTAFMERFKNFENVFKSKNIKCSFYNDRLMFAISTNRNVFEIGSILCPLDNRKAIEKFFDEIISIFLMIDYFKLNEKIGL